MKQTLLKYHGSKFSWRSKIIPLLPDYTHFSSVFLGNAGLEFSLPYVGVSETWNDYSNNLSNLYLVLQNKGMFAEFSRLVGLTLFSETEFWTAKQVVDSPFEYFGPSVNLAWRYYIMNRLSYAGRGTNFATPTSRLRRDMNENVSAYLSAVAYLPEFHKRLQFPDIRCMHFRDFIPQFDRLDGLLYCDPPYMFSTRKSGGYEIEMTDEEHEELLKLLSKIKGKFMLHGFDSELYQRFEKEFGWKRHEFILSKSSSSSKIKPKMKEIIWMNY